MSSNLSGASPLESVAHPESESHVNNPPKPESRLEKIRSGQFSNTLTQTGRKMLPLSKLVEDESNERKTFQSIDELAQSMASVGQIDPLIVRPIREGDHQGKFKILAGHRRYRAALQLGWDTLECLVRENSDTAKERRQSIVSNVQREDLNPIELARALKEHLDHSEDLKTQADLARAIGKHKTWVSGMLRILDLNTDARAQLESSTSKLDYDTVIRIARVDEPNHQDELVGLLLEDTPRPEIRERIQILSGKPVKKVQSQAEINDEPAPKPKYKIPTKLDAYVIIQSSTSNALTKNEKIQALQDAFEFLEAA